MGKWCVNRERERNSVKRKWDNKRGTVARVGYSPIKVTGVLVGKFREHHYKVGFLQVARQLFGNFSYFEQPFAFWAISLVIFLFWNVGAAFSA